MNVLVIGAHPDDEVIGAGGTIARHIKKGDNVLILSGKDKGKSGSILSIFPKSNRALVKGINIVKKHQKPSKQRTRNYELGIQELLTSGILIHSNSQLLVLGTSLAGVWLIHAFVRHYDGDAVRHLH